MSGPTDRDLSAAASGDRRRPSTGHCPPARTRRVRCRDGPLRRRFRQGAGDGRRQGSRLQGHPWRVRFGQDVRSALARGAGADPGVCHCRGADQRGGDPAASPRDGLSPAVRATRDVGESQRSTSDDRRLVVLRAPRGHSGCRRGRPGRSLSRAGGHRRPGGATARRRRGAHARPGRRTARIPTCVGRGGSRSRRSSRGSVGSRMSPRR